jgi:L1 cell adhesion molecule like protein
MLCGVVGCLSKEEVERMVRNAEKYKEEDDKAKARIEAKNKLENFAYSIRNTVKEDAVKNKLSEEDRKKVENAVEDILRWIESNPQASVQQYEAKQKELEQIINPIFTRMYQAGVGGGMPDMNGMGGMGGTPGENKPSGGR